MKIPSSGISCFFDNLEQILISKIEQYPIIVGCVAWLTNENILKTLSTRERVSIIIQREDFLRPDSGYWSSKKLKTLYNQLPDGVKQPGHSWEGWGDIIHSLNSSSPWESAPIRCLGNLNTDKNPAFPRMHNKFLVFCEWHYPNSDDIDLDDYPSGWVEVMPKAIWTGSFNLTDNATKSLENAVYIEDSEIVNAYYNEWQYIFGLSEAIEAGFWDIAWESPDYFRVGT